MTIPPAICLWHLSKDRESFQYSFFQEFNRAIFHFASPDKLHLNLSLCSWIYITRTHLVRLATTRIRPE